MKNLSNLSFQLCTFETTNNLDKLNLKELHLDCCKMNDYSFVFSMQNLERLTLSGQENLDILKTNTLTNLQYLNISNNNIKVICIDNNYINTLSKYINTNIIKIEHKKNIRLYTTKRDCCYAASFSCFELI